MPMGYFNFNKNDRKYGPNNWQNIDVSKNEWLAFDGLSADKNYCQEKLQSPIDLGLEKTSNCEEHHDFRTRVRKSSAAPYTMSTF